MESFTFFFRFAYVTRVVESGVGALCVVKCEFGKLLGIINDAYGMGAIKQYILVVFICVLCDIRCGLILSAV